MRVTAWAEKAVLLVAALAVNLGLYLLVPYIQVLIQKHTEGPKSPKIVQTELAFAPPPANRLVKREIKEIKTQTLAQPTPTPARPSTPGGGLKIDLSPAGGEGLSLVSGGDRTGGIGSGTGNGQGQGMAAMTYQPGETDTDAKPIGRDDPPGWPPRAKREGVSGDVELTWEVNEIGIAQNITIMREDPTGYGFGGSAIESVKKMRFKPATLHKVAVKMQLKRSFHFGIQ